MSVPSPLLAPIPGAEHRDLGSVVLDIVPAGNARVKRTIYRPGFRWTEDMKPVVGTDYCMHAHVGMLVHGHVQLRFADGCTRDYVAPCAFAIEAGHAGWVVGEEPAVLIEVDFMGETASRFGLPASHTHA